MFNAPVTACDLPLSSALHARLQSGDFIDCYKVASATPVRAAAETITAFPGWARLLVAIRKIVTTPLGLINEAPEGRDIIGIFPVESETETEIVAGFNDKHLNFRVSVLSENGLVYLATWVRPHHWGGRIYLGTIMPFHILISRNALARVAATAGPQAA